MPSCTTPMKFIYFIYVFCVYFFFLEYSSTPDLFGSLYCDQRLYFYQLMWEQQKKTSKIKTNSREIEDFAESRLCTQAVWLLYICDAMQHLFVMDVRRRPVGVAANRYTYETETRSAPPPLLYVSACSSCSTRVLAALQPQWNKHMPAKTATWSPGSCSQKLGKFESNRNKKSVFVFRFFFSGTFV